jgi:hypothetical protein
MVAADVNTREADVRGSREAEGGRDERWWWAQGEEPHTRASAGTRCGGMGLHGSSMHGYGSGLQVWRRYGL